MPSLPRCSRRTLSPSFSRRVRAGTPPDASRLDEAVAQARVIDALWQSERSGGWEPVVRD